MAPSPTFLCVDDEPSVLMMEKALLESGGFRVLAAASGQEAISLFKSETVDAVVMDYFMAGMSGITAAKIMKQLKPDIPIVFLSAYSELPGEVLGLSKWWIKKGEEEPERFLARLRALVSEAPSDQQSAKAS